MSRQDVPGGSVCGGKDDEKSHSAGCADALILSSVAGWSSLVARWAHNPKVAGSNPARATKK